MNQIQNIQKYDSVSVKADDSNSSAINEDVVKALVEQGLPRAFNPSTFISRIADNFNISKEEARNCLKAAINQLECKEKAVKQQNDDEKMYAESGYFYPTNPVAQGSEDGMKNLSAFGNYNRLVFGLR